MTKKEQIYNLLLKEDLTVKQIANRLTFKEDYTRTTIFRLVKKEMVFCITQNGNPKIYRAKQTISLEIGLYQAILKKFILVFLDNDLDIEFTNIEFELIENIFKEIRENA